jgi:signal transduction histidine kinase
MPRTLRFRLLLIFALAIAPLAALAVYLALDDGRRDSAEAQSEARATVQLVSQDLSRLIQGSRDLVLGFSRNAGIQSHPEACGALLASLRPLFPQFANMAMIDTERNIVCSAVPTSLRILPTNPGDTDLADRVQKTRDFAVGEVRVSSVSHQPILPLAGPVYDPAGQLRYYFVATIDLAWLNREVSRAPIPKQAILLVLDRNGKVIARNPQSDEWIGAPAPPYEQGLPGQGDFTGEIKGEGGIRRVYSVKRVNSADGLVVVTKIRADEIYRPSRRRLLLHLSGLAIVGLLVLGVTWTGSDRLFARPLSRLVEAARRLGAGDPSSRSDVPYVGEIGQLARSFDQMAEALQLEQAKTFKTAQVLQSIVEGTSTSTGEEFFQSLVRSLSSALGATFAMVGELSETGESARSIANCCQGKLGGNLEYMLRGTPFEGVLQRTLCYFPSDVQRLFPQDAMLRELEIQSCLGWPLVDAGGNPMGLIVVLDQRPLDEGFSKPASILKVFAARAGVELERMRAERALRESMAGRKLAAEQNEEMVRRLRALTARLESVREEEREHIAREIHDELGQQLTALRFDLINLKNRLRDATARSAPVGPLLERFSELTSLVDSTIRSVRRIATELRPGVLDTFGPIAAIEWLAEDFQKRTKIRCAYEGIEDMDGGGELAITLFRICQEALTNVARHAEATEVGIRLTAEGEWLTLEVTDNGKGISPETLARTTSLGVLGMRERARIAGGEIEIGGRVGRGATVIARFPRPQTLGAVV